MKRFIVFFSFFLIIQVSVRGQKFLDLKVGSYNIRYDNKGDRDKGNGWEHRLPVILSILEWESPDFFGAQEVLAHQLADMQNGLPDYVAYGVGRDDGKDKGEAVPVFYRKDRFDHLDQGTFWLSESPEVPSRGWDAALPRVCSWVKLKEKNTGKLIYFFNLHLDHIGTKAREQSMYVVLRKIKEIAKGETVFLTGDFNVDQHNEIYGILQNSGLVFDSYEKTQHKMAWNGTFNAYDTHLFTDSRIDHIFVTADVSVSHYAVFTETYRSKKDDVDDIKKGDFPAELSFKPYEVRLPSDHFPVFIKARLPLD